LTNNVGTVTDALGNQNAAGTMAKIQSDPYLAAGTTVNLSGTVVVPLYCNSDWPLDLTIGANAQYDSTKGRDCRINGTKYDPIGSSPAAAADYNYPWQYNAAPGALAAQYFFAQGGTKPIWCNAAAAGWPTVTCAMYCPLGTPVNTTVPQTWTPTGNTTACCTAVGSPAGCGAVSTYTIPGCNTSAIYCSPAWASLASARAVARVISW
jgi:hypothetical protein